MSRGRRGTLWLLPALALNVPLGAGFASAETPEDSLRTLRPRPGFKVELVAAEPLIREPGRLRLGAGRPALGRRDARLSARHGQQGQARRPDRLPRGHRRRRPLRQVHGLPRRAALPDRRDDLGQGRARDLRPGHLLRRGHRRRRPGGPARGPLHRLRRGQPAAPGQRPALGTGQLGLLRQRRLRRGARLSHASPPRPVGQRLLAEPGGRPAPAGARRSRAVRSIKTGTTLRHPQPRLPHPTGRGTPRPAVGAVAVRPRPRRLGQLVRLQPCHAHLALRPGRPLPAPQSARRLARPARRGAAVGDFALGTGRDTGTPRNEHRGTPGPPAAASWSTATRSSARSSPATGSPASRCTTWSTASC